jgi:hypothetical protein
MRWSPPLQGTDLAVQAALLPVQGFIDQEPTCCLIYRYRQLNDGASVTSGTLEKVGDWFGTEPRPGTNVSKSIPLNWFKEIHSGGDTSASSQAMTDLFAGIQSLLRSSHYAVVDSIFAGADLPRIPSEAMVGLLRYSFAERTKLGQWTALLRRVADVLRARAIDPDHVLRGLDDRQPPAG